MLMQTAAVYSSTVVQYSTTVVQSGSGMIERVITITVEGWSSVVDRKKKNETERSFGARIFNSNTFVGNLVAFRFVQLG